MEIYELQMLNTDETYYVCRLHSLQMDKQAIIYGQW